MSPPWKTSGGKPKNGKSKSARVGFVKYACKISALSKHKQY